MSHIQDFNEVLDINALYSLTQAEWKVLLLIAADSPNREIAKVLCIELKSVHNYRTRIGEKLGLKGFFILGCVARRHHCELSKLYCIWYRLAPSNRY